MASPSTPNRSSSLSRKHRHSKSGASEQGAAPASMPVPLCHVDAKLRENEITTNGYSIPDTAKEHATDLGGTDDDMVYVVHKHTVTIRAPMETHTEIINYNELPPEVKYNPTETLTWAQQTPEYLLLETYAPPQCEICLDHLKKKAASSHSMSKESKPPMGNLNETRAAATMVTDPYARDVHTMDAVKTSRQSDTMAAQMVESQDSSSIVAEVDEALSHPITTKMGEGQEMFTSRQVYFDNIDDDNARRKDAIDLPANTPLSVPLDIPGSFSWSK